MTGDRDGDGDGDGDGGGDGIGTRARVGRRTVLASAATGLAGALAGCGYQPGGGELDWERSIGYAHFGPGRARDDRRWLSDGALLVSIRNRDGTIHDFDRGFVDVEDVHVAAYDSAGEHRWSATAEPQYQPDGDPAIDADGVYVPLEDGSVCAFSRSRTGDDADAVRWTTGSLAEGTLEVVAGDGLVGWTDGSAVGAVDGETGDVRASASGDDLPGPVSAIAVGRSSAAGNGDVELWIATAGDAPTLVGFDGDGTERVRSSLPSDPDWLVTAGSTAVVALAALADDGREVWAVAGDGARGGGGETAAVTDADADTDPQWTLEVPSRLDEPIVVGDRLYATAGGTPLAIDVDGELAWEREAYAVHGRLFADADGVYARGSGPGTGGCGLFALTSDGDDWWAVPAYEDVGCAGDCFLVGDRLVVVDDRELYGFRAKPGTRYSVL